MVRWPTISTGVLRGLLGRTDEWGWRIPYVIHWVWHVPITIFVLFAPESPWWLVRHGKVDEAKSHTTPGLNYSSAALLPVFVFTYDLTVSHVTYCLISEIPSTRLRIKSAVLARNCYNIASIIANFLNPPILNPTAWNLKEPKGRTPAELDILFEKKISARKFSKFEATPFRSDNFEVISDRDILAETNPQSDNKS
ncbi:hypothetical protein N7450_005443 [Penicillium hetheringtonii]|uniref:Uncharacterized protein n=1 Tax=Penicillium hetheringtonii TaxID=911720 RepID=A0AAD6DIC5_9EURO|nr:hypothetical protein N7450_005443 [Penicillium hetheringtonii]